MNEWVVSVDTLVLHLFDKNKRGGEGGRGRGREGRKGTYVIREAADKDLVGRIRYPSSSPPSSSPSSSCCGGKKGLGGRGQAACGLKGWREGGEEEREGGVGERI